MFFDVMINFSISVPNVNGLGTKDMTKNQKSTLKP